MPVRSLAILARRAWSAPGIISPKARPTHPGLLRVAQGVVWPPRHFDWLVLVRNQMHFLTSFGCVWVWRGLWLSSILWFISFLALTWSVKDSAYKLWSSMNCWALSTHDLWVFACQHSIDPDSTAFPMTWAVIKQEAGASVSARGFQLYSLFIDLWNSKVWKWCSSRCCAIESVVCMCIRVLSCMIYNTFYVAKSCRYLTNTNVGYYTQTKVIHSQHWP